MKYKIVEKFISINGEGLESGKPAVFIRFASCNLDCSYCDTKWANVPEVQAQMISKEELREYVEASGITNVTITGGEPLLNPGLEELLDELFEIEKLRVEFETNGSILIAKLNDYRNQTQHNISFTIDYKLPSSGMEAAMNLKNYQLADSRDSVKFVAGSEADLNRAKAIIDEYDLNNRTNAIISPVYGQIDLERIVAFLIENKYNNIKMQLQLHKYIWDVEKRGV